MRLDKYLTKTSVGNRKLAKKLIKDKKIYIDEKLATSESLQVCETSNVYLLNNNNLQKLEYEEYIYLMLNKPKNYVCATKDNLHKSVLELIKDYEERDLHIVGRLDIDTEGLLLITDDGDFTHKITSPKSNISKKYYVEYCGKIKEDAGKSVKEGIVLDDGTITKSGILEVIDEKSAYITIYDGKFHQVKRMFAEIGTHVTYLKRVKIGSLELDEKLELGSYKKLTEQEKNLSMN